ncbi:MAG TPA: LPS assembly protein LptD [Candidatus Binataceae bacterium]|nr:LPS assembly protein LptD [Candidatus Binataceae bacterium]
MDSFLRPRLKSARLTLLLAAVALGFAPATARAQTSLSSVVNNEHQGPLDVTGQNFVYDYKTNSFIVTGDAVVRQQASILTANEIDLARGKRELHAKGQVHMVDALGEIRAREGRINLNDETADLSDATITDHNKTYRLQGTRVRKLLGQRYSVMNGLFTTCACDPGTPDWSISADQMDVHMGDSGTARKAHFNILGYPVLYSPYAVFPADTDRHSGLLAPRIGQSGLRGVQLMQPYYLAINKSSDATAALDVETSQRIGGLAEYRLISGDDDYLAIDAAYYNESIRSQQNRQDDIVDNQIADPNIPTNRYDLLAMTREHLTPDLAVYGDTTTVSDPLLLRELNVWTLSRTASSGIFFPRDYYQMRNAMSDFGGIYSYADGYANLEGTFNQDLIQPQQFALQTLPELVVSGRKDLLGGLLHADYDVTGDNFYRQQGVSGTRLDLSPSVTMPWRLGDYIYGFGTLGLRETMYDTSGDQIDVIPVGTQGRLYNNNLALGPLAPGGFQTREMIYGTAGIATELEKVYNFNWESVQKIKHTIEPYAAYTYVPNVDQGSLPLFDEIDRINGRSLFLYGATSRIFVKLAQSNAAQPEDEDGGGDLDTQTAEGENNGSTNPFRARSYANGSAIEELLRLSVLQAYDTAHAVAKGSSRFSDLDITGTMFPTHVWSMGGQLGYSPQASTIHYASTFVNFQPWWLNNVPRMYMGKATTGSFLQLSYNYIGPGPESEPGVNAAISQFLTMRMYYDLFNRMGVFFAPSYDFTAHHMLSTEYGFRLKSACDCWAFDMGITKTVNPNETQFQFQVTLGGLGSVGQSPFGRNPFQTHVGVLPGY